MGMARHGGEIHVHRLRRDSRCRAREVLFLLTDAARAMGSDVRDAWEERTMAPTIPDSLTANFGLL